MPKKNQQHDELEAFCQSCPAPEEVSTFLERLGMRLDFQMEACPPLISSGLAVLPAQFHFADASGNSILYLAGEDSPLEEGKRLPPHKSRFWAYSGSDANIFGQVIRSMALQWALSLATACSLPVTTHTPGCGVREEGVEQRRCPCRSYSLTQETSAWR